MLVKDLAKIFLGLAESAALYGNEETAGQFRDIAAALQRQRRNLKLNEAETYWRGCSANSSDSPRAEFMTARKAADHLRIVSVTAEPLVRKGALSPLQNFVSFLRERGDADAVAVVSDVVKPRPRKEWLVELKAAGTNRAAFDVAIDEMSADKAIEVDALNAIVAEYTGIKRKTRSRKEAIERIRDQFEADAQYATKVDSIERMTGGRH